LAAATALTISPRTNTAAVVTPSILVEEMELKASDAREPRPVGRRM
jgi:hypothetical protein